MVFILITVLVLLNSCFGQTHASCFTTIIVCVCHALHDSNHDGVVRISVGLNLLRSIEG